MDILLQLLIAGAIMGILDFVWLGYVAKNLYHKEMGGLLLEKFKMAPALLFYIIYVIGTVVFVINPALEKESLWHALSYGALFGFVAYATYDLTGRSVIKGFSLKIVIIDLLWGAVLTATVSTATYLVISALL